MQKPDENIVRIVKELGEAVKGLPETIQPLAFQFLLDYHLPARDRPPSLSVDEPSIERESEDWVQMLADKAGVGSDDIQSLFDRDDDGFSLTSVELGEGEMKRLRNMGLLLLWAVRVVEREIYVPHSELYRVARRLGYPTRNISNAIKGSKYMRSAQLRGEKMVQLTDQWEEQAKELIQNLTGSQ